MLVGFAVRNYRSFREEMALDMRATTLRTLRDTLVFTADAPKKYHLLRSAVIYGPNAAGKSNLVHALAFMRRFVLDSATRYQSGEGISIAPFRLSQEMRSRPSTFEIVFLLSGTRYRYGFSVDRERVHHEWLYRTYKREVRLFERKGKDFEINGRFRKEAPQSLQQKTRPNALFLSVMAQFDSPTAVALLGWFRETLTVFLGVDLLFPYGAPTLERDLQRIEEEPKFRERFRNLLRFADLGIVDLRVQRVPLAKALSDLPREGREFAEKMLQAYGVEAWEKREMPRLQLAHPVFVGERRQGEDFFDLQDESEGTQKFVALLGPVLKALAEGGVLIVDELDVRLHPLMTAALLRLFHTPETNPRNAQLVFTTHDLSLLEADLFRRDQIWFVEKNRYGATELYSLADVKERGDVSFRKRYLQGRYGGVPSLNAFVPYLAEEGVLYE